MSRLLPRTRVWRAMRQLRSFELRQLIAATETKRDTTSVYLRALRRAGYVVERGDRLVLVRDSGPHAPRILMEPYANRPVGVEDRNDGKRYGLDGQQPPVAPPPKIVPRPIVRRPYRRRTPTPPTTGGES